MTESARNRLTKRASKREAIRKQIRDRAEREAAAEQWRLSRLPADITSASDFSRRFAGRKP